MNDRIFDSINTHGGGNTPTTTTPAPAEQPKAVQS